VKQESARIYLCHGLTSVHMW